MCSGKAQPGRLFSGNLPGLPPQRHWQGRVCHGGGVGRHPCHPQLPSRWTRDESSQRRSRRRCCSCERRVPRPVLSYFKQCPAAAFLRLFCICCLTATRVTSPLAPIPTPRQASPALAAWVRAPPSPRGHPAAGAGATSLLSLRPSWQHGAETSLAPAPAPAPAPPVVPSSPRPPPLPPSTP